MEEPEKNWEMAEVIALCRGFQEPKTFTLSLCLTDGSEQGFPLIATSQSPPLKNT
jgi:hypothetical protein